MRENVTAVRCEYCNEIVDLEKQTTWSVHGGMFSFPVARDRFLGEETTRSIDVCPEHMETLLRSVLALLTEEQGQRLWEAIQKNGGEP